MVWTEEQLKKHLASEPLLPVYLLYGEESLLTQSYAARIRDKAVGGGAAGFDCYEFDGDTVSVSRLEDTVQTLPMMADTQCVLVKDMDLTAAENFDRVLELMQHPAPDCVLIFRQITAMPDGGNAKWKKLTEAAATGGAAVEFRKKTGTQLQTLLVRYAAKKHTQLAGADAALLIERCGDDLHLLTHEVDKLSGLAAADGTGVITRDHILCAATRNLEARVYDLSAALLAGRLSEAFEVLDILLANGEKSVGVLTVLGGAFVDMYRVKVARAAGKTNDAVATLFRYGNRSFVLRNAARDAARVETAALRECLDILTEADGLLKGGSVTDERTVLQQTLVRLDQSLRGR